MVINSHIIKQCYRFVQVLHVLQLRRIAVYRPRRIIIMQNNNRNIRISYYYIRRLHIRHPAVAITTSSLTRTSWFRGARVRSPALFGHIYYNTNMTSAHTRFRRYIIPIIVVVKRYTYCILIRSINYYYIIFFFILFQTRFGKTFRRTQCASTQIL